MGRQSAEDAEKWEAKLAQPVTGQRSDSSDELAQLQGFL